LLDCTLHIADYTSQVSYFDNCNRDNLSVILRNSAACYTQHDISYWRVAILTLYSDMSHVHNLN